MIVPGMAVVCFGGPWDGTYRVLFSPSGKVGAYPIRQAVIIQGRVWQRIMGRYVPTDRRTRDGYVVAEWKEDSD